MFVMHDVMLPERCRLLGVVWLPGPPRHPCSGSFDRTVETFTGQLLIIIIIIIIIAIIIIIIIIFVNAINNTILVMMVIIGNYLAFSWWC